MPGSAKHQRLNWIDAAKGLAIAGIVAVHASQRVVDVPPLMLRVFGAGRYGVQVFFLVSGYTIAWSLFARRKTGTAESWRDFYARRATRVAPLAYVGALANVVLNGAPLTALGVLVTALFLQGWDSTFSGLVLGGWVLTVEVTFYALAPLFARWVRSWRTAAMVAGSLVALAVVANRLAAPYVPAARADEFLYFWPPTQLPFVAFGVLLFHLCPPRDSGMVAQLPPRLRLAIAAVLAAVSVLLHDAGSTFLYLAVPAVGLWLVSGRPEWLLSNRALVWLGRISYSVFIWHFFVLDALKSVFRGVPSGPYGLLVLYLSGLAISAVVGVISVRLIESPAARLASRLRAH